VRLEQDQAVLRLDGVDAARQRIARQREIINVRVLPAQGKLEPALAVFVAMTRASVAAGLGEHRHDIVAKGNLSWEFRLRSSRTADQRQKRHTAGARSRGKVTGWQWHNGSG